MIKKVSYFIPLQQLVTKSPFKSRSSFVSHSIRVNARKRSLFQSSIKDTNNELNIVSTQLVSKELKALLNPAGFSLPDQIEEYISIRNTQRKFAIDISKVRNQTSVLMRILGLADYQVDIWFCSDQTIRNLNEESRGIRKSTDVLSFPANDFSSPGVMIDDEYAIEEKLLGDIVISPAYVHRQCMRDEKYSKRK
eukprot:gene14501-19468_t